MVYGSPTIDTGTVNFHTTYPRFTNVLHDRQMDFIRKAV